MSTSSPKSHPDLTESGLTIQSDSENYDPEPEPSSSSPPSSSSSPLILYSPPTIWGLLRGAAINLLLPFVNGLMLGFGELFANEMAFRLGWSGTKVCLISYTVETIFVIRAILSYYVSGASLFRQLHNPLYSSILAHRAGPGVEVREKTASATRRKKSGEGLDVYDELDMYTSME
ncbi:TOM13-domain-containing protein [Tothia fuscella]|uniref:TOM13-domain-containing protein n=1 Tax=Tothia fuscella TaxID=1048955 RepID=A0A9P4P5G1_9PEZI|nr:TOM13-domain-containing protein [Tothia fuscella]